MGNFDLFLEVHVFLNVKQQSGFLKVVTQLRKKTSTKNITVKVSLLRLFSSVIFIASELV